MANHKKECESKEVMTSRIFSLAPRNTSAFQENILIEIIKIAQKQLNGISIDTIVGEARQVNDWGDMLCKIHIADITDPNLYKNYKKALDDLTKKTIIYETKKSLLIVPILQRVYVDRGSADVEVQVAKEIWDCILDFTRRNVSLYNPNIALALPTAGAKRLYEMIANTKPGFVHEWSMEELNKIFKTKYTGFNFRERVLAPAKTHLDEIADWSFNFYPIPSDEEWAEMRKRGKRPVTGFRVVPYRICRGGEDGRNFTKQKLRENHVLLCPKQVRDWLIQNMGFNRNSIHNNDIFLFDCIKKLGNTWLETFEKLHYKMLCVRREIPNPIGYFITLLSNECGIPTERNRT